MPQKENVCCLVLDTLFDLPFIRKRLKCSIQKDTGKSLHWKMTWHRQKLLKMNFRNTFENLSKQMMTWKEQKGDPPSVFSFSTSVLSCELDVTELFVILHL